LVAFKWKTYNVRLRPPHNTIKFFIMKKMTKLEMKRVLGGDAILGTGGGGITCGFQTSTGIWVMASDVNGDGKTKDNAIASATGTGVVTLWDPSANNGTGAMVNSGTPNGHWCCASCPWN
jgi:hypothetical protein